MITRLDAAEREAALARLAGWTYDPDRDAIHGRFTFRNFAAAFAFMTEVAMAADKLDHHPEWSNVYSRVDILLTTHDAGGLSARDIALAEIIDAIFASR